MARDADGGRARDGAPAAVAGAAVQEEEGVGEGVQEGGEGGLDLALDRGRGGFGDLDQNAGRGREFDRAGWWWG